MNFWEATLAIIITIVAVSVATAGGLAAGLWAYFRVQNWQERRVAKKFKNIFKEQP